MFSRIYIPTAPAPKLVSQLSPPPVSGDEHTSGSTSDPDANESPWQDRRGQDGLMASNCASRCVCINGSADVRLNEAVCKRHGSKLATLLAIVELFSVGDTG